MKFKIATLFSMIATGIVIANTAPTPQIVSCAMREGTTLMDITYRVNDPDDAVVSAWPLAFVDGTRSFAKVIRPATFVEGTENNFGTNVLSNTSYPLVWDVGADWNIDLGNIKFEIICKDSRGLLPFDWVSIPATASTEAMTISKNLISSTHVLNAIFFQYALHDSGLNLLNGVLYGADSSGIFRGIELANGTTAMAYATPYLMMNMGLQPAMSEDVNFAIAARAGNTSSNSWYALSKPYSGIPNLVMASGYNNWGQCNIPAGIAKISKISAKNHSLVLKSDGTVVAWGFSSSGLCTIPVGLDNVIEVAAGTTHSLALKNNGTLVAWGNTYNGICAIPVGLSNVTAIAAGREFSLALRSDGKVVSFGSSNFTAQFTVPASVSNVIVTAIAAGYNHSLALKNDSKVVSWGNSYAPVPSNLSNVTAIAAGGMHSLALKADGTVVAWGNNSNGQCTIPAGLSNVTAIAAGYYHSLALRNDGKVFAWGWNNNGQCNIPDLGAKVTAIAVGDYHNLMIVSEPIEE